MELSKAVVCFTSQSDQTAVLVRDRSISGARRPSAMARGMQQ